MKLRLGLIFLLFLAGCAKNESVPSAPHKLPSAKIDPATTGAISGTITFAGDPPKPQPIDMSQDAACVMGQPSPNFGEAYAISQGRLQNVVVYIKDGLADHSYSIPAPAVLDQKGCRYVPHVLGLMAGQQLRIINSDPALHNVHSMAHQNDGWNVSQFPRGEAIEKIFDKPELMIPLQCNNHPWMKMYVNVLPHPFFSVSGADGRFSITGLPPGTYTVTALHEKMGAKSVTVTLGAKESRVADFKFASSDVP